MMMANDLPKDRERVNSRGVPGAPVWVFIYWSTASVESAWYSKGRAADPGHKHGISPEIMVGSPPVCVLPWKITCFCNTRFLQTALLTGASTSTNPAVTFSTLNFLLPKLCPYSSALSWGMESTFLWFSDMWLQTAGYKPYGCTSSSEKCKCSPKSISCGKTRNAILSFLVLLYSFW